MQPPQNISSAGDQDVFDVIARSIPAHYWWALGMVVATVLFGLLFFRTPESVLDETMQIAGESIDGRVVSVLSEERVGDGATAGLVQQVMVRLTSGPRAGEEVQVTHGEFEALTEAGRVHVGDRVLVEFASGEGGERYYITDVVRWPALLTLALLFGIAVIAVGGAVGLRALVSMGFTILIIAFFIIPGIVAGYNPLIICIAGSLTLMTASVYLTYGWHWKTHAAVLGLVAGLVVTGFLATVFVDWARLTGYSSESAQYIRFGSRVTIDMRGLLLGGIVIGALGVLDDVTTNQSSVTFELKRTSPELSWTELFRRSMVVGRDHIAAVVNTLLLAYVGASLPLLVLMAVENTPLGQTISREFIAEEIVRTLVGSLGLVLATPITSLIAGMIAQRSECLDETNDVTPTTEDT